MIFFNYKIKMIIVGRKIDQEQEQKQRGTGLIKNNNDAHFDPRSDVLRRRRKQKIIF